MMPQEPYANPPTQAFAVTLYGDTFCICATPEEAEEAEQGIMHLNRWYVMSAPHSFDIEETSAEPTDPFARGWHVVWRTGYGGWNAEPVCHTVYEKVNRNSSDSKEAYVTAPTALLAIERTKLLLIETGRKR